MPASEWKTLPWCLSKLQQMHISQLGLAYYLHVTPPDPAGCAWLLRGLTTQVCHTHLCFSADIVVAKAVLKMRGVEVLMQLRPFWKQEQYCTWHSPARLAVMAPMIDDVYVPNAMQDPPRYYHNVEFIPAHLLPLVSAGRLRRLCIYSSPYVPVFAPLKGICSIANLSNLTSLQLANCSFLQLTELQHFRHLLELRLRFLAFMSIPSPLTP